jgi:DNA-binding CsgD family transcriptional regulator
MREEAHGMRVLAGSGIESETHLAFAALQQIVRPILDLVDRLPLPQASALRGALGVADGETDEPFLVSLAALSLLAEAAEEQPLLCLVDDAHWLDDASAGALVFVARRLEAEGIVLLFAAREGESRRFEAPGLPELRLGGLDATAAEALIDHEVHDKLSPEVRTRLVAEANGNPLALLELSSALSEAQLSGAEPVLAPIPVSARVERVFLARIRDLPEETQTVLLVAAAEDTGELAVVLPAAAGLAAPPEALDPAERGGLVSVHGPRLEFRHPLVRSAVYQGATLSKRRAVHEALASVLTAEGDADRRAWHRASATVEPDPAVVEDLVQAAKRAQRRSGFAAASVAYERAAALTADDRQQVQQLTSAAETAWLAGGLDRAATLLERARPRVSDAVERADVDRWRGLIEMNRGMPVSGYDILLRAATDVAGADAERALDLLNMAGVAAAYAGDLSGQVAVAEAARELAFEETEFARMLSALLIGIGAHAERNFASAVPRLRLALELADEIAAADGSQPLALMFAGRAALYLGDDDAVYRAHRRAETRARETGGFGSLAQLLAIVTTSELWLGRWDAAEADASEGVRLGEEIGQEHLVAQARVLLALLAALRGDEDQCRVLAERSREFATARGLGVVQEIARWTLTLLELGLGRAEEALTSAREISNTLAVYWAALDRIEAAVRAGEDALARSWLDEFEPWAEDAAPWARAVALHCRALLAESDSEAEELFAATLDAHTRAGRPFEHARSELAYGEFLRRTRRRVEARRHLNAALDGFTALGASTWAERARVELRASGKTARKRDPSTRGDLTPQELQIARFVAQGLSNREVAAQLFLSPRTIDFHLRNVFRKLGITSRTALVRLDLAEGEAENPVFPPVRT